MTIGKTIALTKRTFVGKVMSLLFNMLPSFIHSINSVGHPRRRSNKESIVQGFPGSAIVKNLPANAGDVGLIPGSGRPLGGGIGNPLQYSCPSNPVNRGVCWAIVHRAAESDTI